MQVALITSMLPGGSTDCSGEGGQEQDRQPEQLQDSITVATVDSYQASFDLVHSDRDSMLLLCHKDCHTTDHQLRDCGSCQPCLALLSDMLHA